MSMTDSDPPLKVPKLEVPKYEIITVSLDSQTPRGKNGTSRHSSVGSGWSRISAHVKSRSPSLCSLPSANASSRSSHTSPDVEEVFPDIKPKIVIGSDTDDDEEPETASSNDDTTSGDDTSSRDETSASEEEEGEESVQGKRKRKFSASNRKEGLQGASGKKKKKSERKKLTKKGDLGTKSRNSNPGYRKVGGRIYHSELGKTCHWCRQKTVELHVECSLCPIRFCGACLLNRNGEIADQEVRVEWVCPKCRGGCGAGCKNCCNCGPCRKAGGLGPTGQLVNTARKARFSNAHDYLVHLKTKESREEIALRKKGKKWTMASGACFRSSAFIKSAKEEAILVKAELHWKDIGKKERLGVLEEEEEEEAADLEEETEEDDDDDDDEKEEEEEDEEEEEEEEKEEKKGVKETAELHGNIVSAAEVHRGISRYSVTQVFRERLEGASDAERNDIDHEPQLGSSRDEPQVEETVTRRVTRSARHMSETDCQPTNSTVQPSSSEEDTSENKSSETNSHDNVSHGGTQATQGSEFARQLHEITSKATSKKEVRKMWEHVNFRKPMMKLRQTRSGAIAVPGAVNGLSYLDHYPDFGEKLAESRSQREKARLLRGFLFWIEHSCMDGAYRPWRDAPEVDDSGDCVEINRPDCEMTPVLTIDEDEDDGKATKPVKTFSSPQLDVLPFPVRVKKEKE